MCIRDRIEANIQHLLRNFKTSFGNDFKIHRIPMPADRNGNYPDEPSGCSEIGKGCYYTYTNALFINELILVPIYFDGEGTDKVALEIWKNLMPGYEIVGIDCSEIIKEYGAVHCITKEIGVADPLRIVHEKIKSGCENQETEFIAKVQHLSGIDEVKIFYSINETGIFDSIEMLESIDNQWITTIPGFNKGDKISYFIEAIANNGKKMKRPIVGEKGAWKFKVECDVSSTSSVLNNQINIFPNPTGAFIEISSEMSEIADFTLFDQMGGIILKKEQTNLPDKVDLSKYLSLIHI